MVQKTLCFQFSGDQAVRYSRLSYPMPRLGRKRNRVMDVAVKLIKPSVEVIESYKEALTNGWSPDTVRAEAATEELVAISNDPAAFINSLTDLEAKGSPILMPDGSLAERLPGYPATRLHSVDLGW